MDAGNGGNASSAPISLDHIQNYIQTHISNLSEMLNEQYAKLAEVRKKIEQEKESFDSTHKIISSFKDPIKLNVGGTIFMTSKSTISKQESMLSAMFSGRHTLEKGEDGAYFIDRDPKHFGKILNFLRDGEFQMPMDELERKELMREADYYSMAGLIEFLSGGGVVDLSDRLQPRFDSIRKGLHVVIDGATASSLAHTWEYALVASVTNGVHSCTFDWKGIHIMIGVAGANINAESNLYNVHTHSQSMVLYSIGLLYGGGNRLKNKSSYGPGLVTVQLDCDNRTVTWIYGTDRFTEPFLQNLQAPFSFCVDLYNSTAIISAIE